MRGTKKAEIKARVERVAEQLGITELLKRRPHALSGGERQRVALGRVAADMLGNAIYGSMPSPPSRRKLVCNRLRAL